ncbi:alpha/beta fold hydrolase [Ferruginibacter sp.]|uniref:alpha/beta fold hydrolase n=1 Tax=Ferruginibacter sp. TaxID=1940288 RepID=UPI0019C4190F|nr:alpha/beta hydrolase [Ferruginibacter sp.]MBC7627529.1 alpha/beta hydrolase [Ferruginibacter sp.]
MKKSFIIISIAILITGSVYAQSKSIYGNNPKTGRQLNTRGFNMYYEIYGTGKPLLIIHGNGGSIKDFSKQIPYFKKEYKVILADSRAQGRSTDTKDSLDYNMMADDLNALLNHLHLDSCFVIGWSDGGINGLLLAIRHPEKVKKLAVTGANLWPDSSAVDPKILNWLAGMVDSLKKVNQTPEIKNQYKLLEMMTREPNITLNQLHTVKCPTLVIGGDHDALLPRHTLIIAENIPQSYLWILPNSGHATPVNYSKQFNETINDFFKTPYRIIEGIDRLN